MDTSGPSHRSPFSSKGYTNGFLDENGNEVSRTPSFADGKGSGTGLYAEMQAWIKAENTVEPQFTAEELKQKEIEETEAEKTAYIGLRLSEYPSIGDQLDYIYHNGLEAWKTDIITPIKEKYPKPFVKI